MQAMQLHAYRACNPKIPTPRVSKDLPLGSTPFYYTDHLHKVEPASELEIDSYHSAKWKGHDLNSPVKKMYESTAMEDLNTAMLKKERENARLLPILKKACKRVKYLPSRPSSTPSSPRIPGQDKGKG